MSQSGVPIVSQAAQIANTIGSSIGDIFAGKNPFEALGRIIASPIAAVGDLVNDVSFNTLANQPIAGNFFQGSRDFVENPYSKDAAVKLGKGTLEAGTIALTVGSSAGLDSAFSLKNVGTVALDAGKGSLIGKAVGSGDISKLFGAASGALGIDVPPELSNLYNQYAPIVGSLIPSGSSPVSSSGGDRTFSSPAQSLKSGFGALEVTMLLAGAGLVFYLAVKK